MLVGFLLLSLPMAGGVYPSRPVLFQSWGLFFFLLLLFLPSPVHFTFDGAQKSWAGPWETNPRARVWSWTQAPAPKPRQWPQGLCSGSAEPRAPTPTPALPRSWAAPNQPWCRRLSGLWAPDSGQEHPALPALLAPTALFIPWCWTRWESPNMGGNTIAQGGQDPSACPQQAPAFMDPSEKSLGRIRATCSQPGSSVTCCSIIACCCCRRAWSWGGERICCICCGVIICGDIMATDTGTCREEGHVTTPKSNPRKPPPNADSLQVPPTPRLSWGSLLAPQRCVTFGWSPWPPVCPGMPKPLLGTRWWHGGALRCRWHPGEALCPQRLL